MRRGFSAIIILTITVVFSCACKNNEKYPYAIKDFKKDYRPYLAEAVSKNLVGYDSCVRFIKEQLSDEELLKLSNSEHPTLRAVALEELIDRNSVDQFNIIKNHLDDTAIVIKYMGEFGVQFTTVSDNMIMETEFRDSAEMQKVTELVIKEHSYLSSAYSILIRLNNNPAYYPIIVAMTKYRALQVNAMFPTYTDHRYGSMLSMCVSEYIQKLTEERTLELEKWLTGSDDGDCSSSIKSKDELTPFKQ